MNSSDKWLIKTLKLRLSLLLMIMSGVYLVINSGCTYQQIHPTPVFEIEHDASSRRAFEAALREFAQQNGFAVVDNSKSYPSGADIFSYKLVGDKGTVFDIKDKLDGKRFVVALFDEANGEGVQTFNSLLLFLKEKFPKSTIIRQNRE